MFRGVSQVAAEIRTTESRAILPAYVESFRTTAVSYQPRQVCDIQQLNFTPKRKHNEAVAATD